MTQDEIIEMAMEAEFVSHGKPSEEESELFVCTDKDIYKFAKLVAEKERKWVGLTEVEIIGMTCDCEKITMDCMIDFANAIQDKLKEKNT